MPTLLEQIINKHKEDRIRIKELKAKHAEELRVIEEFQSKREAALLERGNMTCFGYLTDLYVNGRDGKTEAKKTEANINIDQTKIEHWLLKMLNQVGEGIKTEFGTVYKTRKESVTCADFDLFVDSVMLKDAAESVLSKLMYETNLTVPDETNEQILEIIRSTIHQNMHLEYLTKAVRKESILELMGEADPKTGSRPNTPPAGVNYVAIQTVGVRKAK